MQKQNQKKRPTPKIRTGDKAVEEDCSGILKDKDEEWLGGFGDVDETDLFFNEVFFNSLSDKTNALPDFTLDKETDDVSEKLFFSEGKGNLGTTTTVDKKDDTGVSVDFEEVDVAAANTGVEEKDCDTTADSALKDETSAGEGLNYEPVVYSYETL